MLVSFSKKKKKKEIIGHNVLGTKNTESDASQLK